MATFSNQNKNTASFNEYVKGGNAPKYDSYLEYDEAVDPISGNARYYDTIGNTPSFSNQAKNSASLSGQSKS